MIVSEFTFEEPFGHLRSGTKSLLGGGIRRNYLLLFLLLVFLTALLSVDLLTKNKRVRRSEDPRKVRSIKG